MKQKYKWFIGAMIAGVLGMGATSCVDEINSVTAFSKKHRVDLLLKILYLIVSLIPGSF